MRTLILLSFLLVAALVLSCDLRSGTAKEEMEKWQAKPSPTLAPAAAETPIDAADIAAIDTTLQGDMLSANGQNQNTTKECTKYRSEEHTSELQSRFGIS